MTIMLIGGGIVCGWVFLAVLSGERERSALEAETLIRSARAQAASAASNSAANNALSTVAGHDEKLT